MGKNKETTATVLGIPVNGTEGGEVLQASVKDKERSNPVEPDTPYSI